MHPQLGRSFTAAEDTYGAPPLAIVSHALWQNELGGSSTMIGRSVLVDGEQHTLVGVAPPAPGAPGAPDESEVAANRTPGELINVDWAIVSSRYFETLRMPASGRTLTATGVLAYVVAAAALAVVAIAAAATPAWRARITSPAPAIRND